MEDRPCCRTNLGAAPLAAVYLPILQFVVRGDLIASLTGNSIRVEVLDEPLETVVFSLKISM